MFEITVENGSSAARQKPLYARGPQRRRRTCIVWLPSRTYDESRLPPACPVWRWRTRVVIGSVCARLQLPPTSLDRDRACISSLSNLPMSVMSARRAN